MNRRSNTVLCVVIVGGAIAGCDRTPVIPPNLLLITVDTLRADHLGCYGYPTGTSPEVDALARHSTRYADAVSPTSWTLPAHASLLTGLYPAEHGAQTRKLALPPSATTLQSLLGEEGYETVGVTTHHYLGPRYGFDRGWDHFENALSEESAHQPVAEPAVDAVLAWLAGRTDPDRPFFLWVHIFDPHWDYSPPPPLDAMYDPDYRGSMSGSHTALKPFIRALQDGPPPELTERDLQHLLALYDGEIRYVDRALGRLFDGLREIEKLGSTMIAVTSDHGEEFMEHGSLEGHQWTLHDEVVRVPLIIKHAGSRSTMEVVERAVSNVGLPGTLLDRLGVEHELRRLDGETAHQFVDLIQSEERQLGLYDGGFKLLRLDDGKEMLFDDRAEKRDVAAEHPEVVARLSRQLDSVLVGMRPLPDAGTKRGRLDRRTVQRLKSLGYVE